jgi:PAS domain S-box-containing protein
MSKNLNITDLVSIRTLEKIQDNFSEATNIPCVIRDLKGQVITKYSNPNRLWLEASKHPEMESQILFNVIQSLEKCGKTGQTQIYTPYLNLHAFCVPIGINGKISAFFIGGLSRVGNPDIELCSPEAQKLQIDLDTFLEYYLELPLVTMERLEACGNLFKIIASILSSLAKEGTEAKAKVDEISTLNNLLEKKVEKSSSELYQSLEKYKQLFNSIHDGIYFADRDGLIKEINPAGARMLGYNREDLLGKNLRDLFVNPTDRDQFVKKLYRQKHYEHYNPHVRLKDGSTKTFETNATVIQDSNGHIIGVQGIFRDIGHRTHGNLRRITKNDTSTTVSQDTKNY